MFKFALFTTILCLASAAYSADLEKIEAIQHKKIKELNYRLDHASELDLIKVWSMNVATGNNWFYDDSGSITPYFGGGGLTASALNGNHLEFAGLVHIPTTGTYKIEIVAIPSDKNNVSTSAVKKEDLNKTMSFNVTVGSLKGEVPALEVSTFTKTVSKPRGNILQTSRPIAPALTFTSEPGQLAAGPQELWFQFDPYNGRKDLHIVQARLKFVK